MAKSKFLTINILWVFLLLLIIIFGYIVVKNNSNYEHFPSWLSKVAEKASSMASKAKQITGNSIDVGDKLSHRIQQMTSPGSPLSQVAAMNPMAKKMLDEAQHDAIEADEKLDELEHVKKEVDKVHDDIKKDTKEAQKQGGDPSQSPKPNKNIHHTKLHHNKHHSNHHTKLHHHTKRHHKRKVSGNYD